MECFDAKEGVVVSTIKLKKKKEASEISLHRTVHMIWWDDILLKMLVLLQVVVALPATPCWIRLLLYCFGGCEFIASCLSITNYDRILHSSLINANTTFPRACIAARDFTMHSHPSTQQITNLIKCRVATGATHTYNTTNTTNKSSSHQFIRNVKCNETAETSLFFCSFIVHTIAHCFAAN